MSRTMEDISLKHDNGDALRFKGRLFSECSHFDEESGSLTRQQLYVTDTGEKVYYIVRGAGKERSRSVYKLSVDGDLCVIDNGKDALTMNFDMLMLAVKSLCNLASDARPPIEAVEDMLKAANA
ncbi:MAG: hypothetical protein K2H64_02720 [Desulfovibrio sp.]|nr:hypothetical protein [Desulfovibrio sp.]